MNKWINEWTNEWMHECFFFFLRILNALCSNVYQIYCCWICNRIFFADFGFFQHQTYRQCWWQQAHQNCPCAPASLNQSNKRHVGSWWPVGCGLNMFWNYIINHHFFSRDFQRFINGGFRNYTHIFGSTLNDHLDLDVQTWGYWLKWCIADSWF